MSLYVRQTYHTSYNVLRRLRAWHYTFYAKPYPPPWIGSNVWVHCTMSTYVHLAVIRKTMQGKAFPLYHLLSCNIISHVGATSWTKQSALGIIVPHICATLGPSPRSALGHVLLGCGVQVYTASIPNDACVFENALTCQCIDARVPDALLGWDMLSEHLCCAPVQMFKCFSSIPLPVFCWYLRFDSHLKIPL